MDDASKAFNALTPEEVKAAYGGAQKVGWMSELGTGRVISVEIDGKEHNPADVVKAVHDHKASGAN
jgi:hypothetical protein